MDGKLQSTQHSTVSDDFDVTEFGINVEELVKETPVEVEIPAWVLVELIHKKQGEEIRYKLDGQDFCVSRSPV